MPRSCHATRRRLAPPFPGGRREVSLCLSMPRGLGSRGGLGGPRQSPCGSCGFNPGGTATTKDVTEPGQDRLAEEPRYDLSPRSLLQGDGKRRSVARRFAPAEGMSWVGSGRRDPGGSGHAAGSPLRPRIRPGTQFQGTALPRVWLTAEGGPGRPAGFRQAFAAEKGLLLRKNERIRPRARKAAPMMNEYIAALAVSVPQASLARATSCGPTMPAAAHAVRMTP